MRACDTWVKVLLFDPKFIYEAKQAFSQTQKFPADPISNSGIQASACILRHQKLVKLLIVWYAIDEVCRDAVTQDLHQQQGRNSH